MTERLSAFDYDGYYNRVLQSPCFLCSLAAHQRVTHHEYYVFEDEFAVVVLDRYPTQSGYCLVFPKQHVEQIFLLDERTFLRLQVIVHRTVKAVQLAMQAERVYTACLGSQLLTPHIHYHVVPIPPGLPLEKQQWEALDKSRGILQYSEEVLADIALKIKSAMEDC